MNAFLILFFKSLFLGIFSMLVLTIPGFAIGLLIKPLGVSVTGEPGEIIEGSIAVTNPNEAPLHINVQTTDESPLREEFPDWLNLDKDNFHLEPNGTEHLNYTITIPEEATGEFMMKISFGEERDPSQGMIQMVTRLAIYLVATVEGTEVYEGEVQEIKFDPENPKTLHVTVTNKGNVFVKPKGECRIINKNTGQTVVEFIVNEKRVAVLQNSTEMLVGEMEEELSPGNYLVIVSLPFPNTLNEISKAMDYTVPASLD